MAWFDATVIDPAQGASGFPLGKHLVIIKGSAQVAAKGDANNGLLNLTCQIIEGENKGHEGVYRLNMWHTNPQTREIAGRQLSALCHVTGKYKLEIPNPMGAEMFNIPFFIQVTKQKDNSEYTEISAVFDAAGNAPVKGQAPASAPQAAYQPPPQTQPQAAQPPQGQPAWQQPQAQPQQQPAQQPAQQPSWQPPATGGAPIQQQPAAGQGQPSWAQQPAGGAQPSWAQR